MPSVYDVNHSPGSIVSIIGSTFSNGEVAKFYHTCYRNVEFQFQDKIFNKVRKTEKICLAQQYFQRNSSRRKVQFFPTCSFVKFILGPVRYWIMYGSSGRNSLKNPNIPIQMDNLTQGSILPVYQVTKEETFITATGRIALWPHFPASKSFIYTVSSWQAVPLRHQYSTSATFQNINERMT